MPIFRCRAKHIDEDASMDENMMKIYGLIDGRKSLASIAFASGMTMTEFQRSVKTLIDLDWIVPVDTEDALAE